jgi:hypothetical protein
MLLKTIRELERKSSNSSESEYHDKTLFTIATSWHQVLLQAKTDSAHPAPCASPVVWQSSQLHAPRFTQIGTW